MSAVPVRQPPQCTLRTGTCRSLQGQDQLGDRLWGGSPVGARATGARQAGTRAGEQEGPPPCPTPRAGQRAPGLGGGATWGGWPCERGPQPLLGSGAQCVAAHHSPASTVPGVWLQTSLWGPWCFPRKADLQDREQGGHAGSTPALPCLQLGGVGPRRVFLRGVWVRTCETWLVQQTPSWRWPLAPAAPGCG